MSNHIDEKIYTQEDMDSVLTAMRKTAKENEQSHQLLWAVVHAAGGEVSVPYALWMEPSEERELVVWDDFATLTMKLKAIDPAVTRQRRKHEQL